MKGIKLEKSDQRHALTGQYTAPKDILQSTTGNCEAYDELAANQMQRSLYNKQSEYQKRRFGRTLDGKTDGIQQEEQDLKRRKTEKDEDEEETPDSYMMPRTSQHVITELSENVITDVPGVPNLQFFKPSDKQHFELLFDERSAEDMTEEERKRKQVLKWVLRIKNGLPTSRKIAFKALTRKAPSFGAPLLLDSILPILLDKSIEDQEHQLMLKLIDRILFQLQDVVKPYTHKLLVVLCPMLVDAVPLTRATGRDIIATLSKAVGLPTMIYSMRPDLDHEDEYVRNTTARAMAVVSKTFGANQLLPFLRLVCRSKKSWKARHTGIKVVQQLAILLGIGILPHLSDLIECIETGFQDEHPPVRIIAAQTVSSLAQSCQPYGIERFNPVLEPLWRGIKYNRGRELAAFLKALGFLIPLMDSEYASYYTEEVMKIIKRELTSPNDEMKKTVLFVIQKCAAANGVTPQYLRQELAPDFFKQFWVRRIALDRQLNSIVTYTTVVLADKVGASFTLEKLLYPLKDESEPFRTMGAYAVSRVVKAMGMNDVDDRLEARLLDALLIAFQDQTNGDRVIYTSIGNVAKSLGTRMKPYIGPVSSVILEHLKHRKPLVRTHAANLCTLLIPVFKTCGEVALINKFSIILFESLGEVYPEVLAAIIFAMDKAAQQIKLTELQPPPNQILPTLTPILRNNHPLVQESTVRLVGRIAKRGPEYVSPKEWMRICSELLEMLKSPVKSIRRAANTTFGYIAKAIGPQDVLVTLLNNLKVQERQLRVCTSVAIGIVAKTCGPYVVIPALMNEYRTPDTNVQNGILKALVFMLEYIGPMSKDYVYPLVPLLQDALTDRDLVHRQTAATCIKNLAVNCSGAGVEDAFIHFINLLIPNVFETSPHVISRILEGLDGLRVALGPGVFMNYAWGGLFHPAKNVRTAYWKLFDAAYVAQPDSLVPYYPVNDVEELGLVL
ncbi:unnamed protein product [Kluyveromyces dobzhanskii CBS 2104]|uniref:WGS project CCBQ000000000 data, contig 00107 n=1 Tax=Kluyveromyces dobzhanskii CBS 2104 TaxID=1427455 RepID=A0A0A8KZ08_9SACH|nr:unnamed protein product [Kluyveromyces dobzhanskii CBS 2104]